MGVKMPRYLVLLPTLAVLGASTPLMAHGLREQPHYHSPVPLWLYLTGAAVAIVCTFLIIAFFFRTRPPTTNYVRLNLLASPFGRLLVHPFFLCALKLLAAGLFVLLVLCGLVGNQNPHRNLLPTFVWVIWWVGFAYISALVGNGWAVVNPWKILFRAADTLYRRVRPERRLSLRLPYPQRLGVWPGFLLFVSFAWVELVYTQWAVPINLALLIIAYSAITWTGMILFGEEKWLRHGEAFSIVFGLLARFAPTEVRVTDQGVCRSCSIACGDRDGECINCYECFERATRHQRELNLRPVAVGLLRPEAVSPSLAAFVLLMLSTVTFDGISVTPAWADFKDSLQTLFAGENGPQSVIAGSAEVLIFLALFMSTYLIFCKLMVLVSGSRLSVGTWARTFVFSLVPIALAFHLSHYLSFLLIQGQLVIPLASDPFGFAWNLLGTRDYWPDFSIIGVRFVWLTAVVTIVLGHIIAVYLADGIALRTLGDRKIAFRSQYPMLILMICYTVVSLWIIGQPIVENPQ